MNGPDPRGGPQITCGPEKEDIEAIIERLVAKAHIGDLVDELRRGSLAQTQLVDAFEKELHLSRTTALALLKKVADSGVQAEQADKPGAETPTQSAEETSTLFVSQDRVTLRSPARVNAGAPIELDWRGPNAPGDMIFIAKTEVPGNRYITSDRNRYRTAKGPIAELVAPAETGNYEIRYFSYANGSVLSAAALSVE